MAFGDQIEWYEEVTSTMEVAVSRGREGAPEGLLVVAERQTAGRGRLGREWFSPDGGLWLSLLLRPALPLDLLGLVGLCFSVAAAETVAAAANLAAGVKWPNDVIVKGRKVAGLLAESHVEAGKVEFVVIGVGLNANIPAEAFPEPLRNKATSLLIEKGTAFSCRAILRQFLDHGEPLYRLLGAGKSDEILKRWRELDVGMGRPVRVVLDEKVVEGKAAGIGIEGALLVETASGVAAISSGEVEWL